MLFAAKRVVDVRIIFEQVDDEVAVGSEVFVVLVVIDAVYAVAVDAV